MVRADKLLQTKLREKEIKEALKEKKQAEKDGKEEVTPASSTCRQQPSVSTLSPPCLDMLRFSVNIGVCIVSCCRMQTNLAGFVCTAGCMTVLLAGKQPALSLLTDPSAAVLPCLAHTAVN